MPNGIRGEAWPSLNADIVFTLRDSGIEKAYAVSPDFEGRKTLKVEKVDGQTRIMLPKELLKAYTIVYME